MPTPHAQVGAIVNPPGTWMHWTFDRNVTAGAQLRT